MEVLLEKLGWKKMAVIIVGICIIALIVLILSFTKNEKNVFDNKKTDVKIEKEWKTTTGEKLKGSFSTPAQASIKNSYYELVYPTYYKKEEIEDKNYLSRVRLLYKESNASIDLSVVDESKKPIEEFEGPYIADKSYEPESYPLGEFIVDEFYKVDPQSGQLIEKVIFVKKNGKIIKADFSYKKDSPDYRIERDFVRLVSSIR